MRLQLGPWDLSASATKQEESKREISNGTMAPEPAPEMADTSNTEEAWDEEQLEQALKTLKEMHIQVSLLYIFLVDLGELIELL